VKKAMLASIVVAAMGSLSGYQAPQTQTERELLALERASLDGWLKGDAGPMLAAADPEITLFHVMTPGRLEGIASVRELYAAYNGRPLYDSYQIASPKVQAGADIAVLTYQLVTRNGDGTQRYNATEVFQRKSAGWKVIHSHFSAGGSRP